jgi:hypothetical protein
MIAKKINAVFCYIKDYLDGKEQTIWEVGEQFSYFK